jgi:flagellar hook-associated protein 1 FlgK
MGLGLGFTIGTSGLLAHQRAIEVTGNNLANMATRGYHRQSVTLDPASPQKIRTGLFIGRGVEVGDITRQINVALEARLRGSISDESRTAVRQGVLEQLETIQNELSDSDLSTYLSNFFSSFSELAGNPQDNALRTLTLQSGITLSTFVQNLRANYVDLRTQIDVSLKNQTQAVNDLLDRVELVTQSIITSEGSSGGAADLRDERDRLLSELSQHLDISVNELPYGSIDIYVGSIPIMLTGRSRGVDVQTKVVDGEPVTEVVVAADKTALDISSGELGALIGSRGDVVQPAIETLDRFANELIYQINRVHSQGQGLRGYTSLTGTVKVEDAAVPLNEELAGLNFPVSNGSFLIHVTQKSTGQQVTTRIAVDLDNLDPANNTTLTDLVGQLDGVTDITAVIDAAGRVQLDTAGSDFEITFSEDSSGVLAALGLNTLFKGSDASDIALNEVVAQTPGLLAAAQGNLAGDNRNALALAELRDTKFATIDGLSITEYWNRHLEDIAVKHAQSKTQLEADKLVRENLESQQQSVSGVNSDEETINLLAFQRGYQASARFITVVDEMMQTLLNLL